MKKGIEYYIDRISILLILDRKGHMVWVCLSVTPLLPERELEAEAKQALGLHFIIYTFQSTLKRNLHREFYTLLINLLCLETQWVIY